MNRRCVIIHRGENLVLLAEYAQNAEPGQPIDDMQLVLQRQRQELERRMKVDKAKQKIYYEHGFGREMESELF